MGEAPGMFRYRFVSYPVPLILGLSLTISSLLSPVIKVLIQDFTQMTYRSNLSKMPSPHSYNPMCQTLFSHRLFLTYIVAGTIEIHDTIPQNA